MLRLFKKMTMSIVGLAFISGLVMVPVSGYADYYHYHHHYYHDHHYHDHYYHDHYYHDHYYHHSDNNLAAGLIVGGALGLIAAGAMSQQQPQYQTNTVTTQSCSKERLGSTQFRGQNGRLYNQTAYRTVCN